MKICIIIPAHNEALNIDMVIQSYINQTIVPDKLIIIDDNSIDETHHIAKSLQEDHHWIKTIKIKSDKGHQPGEKVVNAFNEGFKLVSDEDFDLIGKFDADIVLPENYFEKMTEIFTENQTVGIAGGNLYIEKNGNWEYENISKKTKVRGPVKLYRKKCFEEIGGLKKSIGWDTVDELLAQYHGWEIRTDETLKVKHLKPTGQVYAKSARFKQGEAFYKMRYGFWLSAIASAKLAVRKKSVSFFMDSIQGFLKSKQGKIPFIVSEKEGEFIRKLRWDGIKKKVLGSK